MPTTSSGDVNKINSDGEFSTLVDAASYTLAMMNLVDLNDNNVPSCSRFFAP